MPEKKEKKNTTKKTDDSKKKKTNTTRKNTRKNNKSKENIYIKETEPEVKKEETKEINENKQNTKSEKILLIVFIILLITVIVLGIVVNLKKEEYKKSRVSLIYEVRKKENDDTIKINLKELYKQDNMYVIKVTNYLGDSINEEELEYTMTIENNSKSIVKITKDDEDKNLLKDNKKVVLENIKFGNKKKEETYYRISISEKKNLKKNDELIINIKT